MDGDDALIPVFIPALGAMLLRAEDVKGSPLSECEVLRVRDAATCMMMDAADVRKLEESRGYKDIDPENCWHDFQILRRELGRLPELPTGPKFRTLDNNDPEYLATVRHAQETLPEFRQLIHKCKQTGAMPMVKALLKDGEQSKYMWLCNAREFGYGFSGELFEVPGELASYTVGDRLELATDDIVDWMVNDDGVLYGGYSIRYQRERMPIDERSAYDDYIGVTKYV